MWGVGCRVPGSGYRVSDLVLRVHDSGFRVFWLRVSGYGFRVYGKGSRVTVLRVSGLWVTGYGLRVTGI